MYPDGGTKVDCLPCCCGGIDYRQEVLNRLRDNLKIQHNEGSCQSWLGLTFCSCFIIAHSYNLIHYAQFKRYGKHISTPQQWSLLKDFYLINSTNGDWLKLVKDQKHTENHPYFRKKRSTTKKIVDAVLGQRKTPTRSYLRESPPTNRSVIGPLFDDFNVKRATETHDKYWGPFHQISGLQMQ